MEDNLLTVKTDIEEAIESPIHTNESYKSIILDSETNTQSTDSNTNIIANNNSCKKICCEKICCNIICKYFCNPRYCLMGFVCVGISCIIYLIIYILVVGN